ncbi:hypothetical protein AMECASPLE_017102 [Ameca splendens]|uniref:Uncharacterized protein n=1 Tax=Ameca splendens TaxID=208324 RepID=A0ABV0Y2T5_9TELE
MRGGHHQRGCGCRQLFRKLLSKCDCCSVRSRAESYSVAGSEGSIAPSVGSLTHQASCSTSPCSHSSSGASRHPVSALKKWLTNPVRKLSSDPTGGTGKAEKQTFKAEGKQMSFLHSEAQQSSLEMHNNYTILSSENMEGKSPTAVSPSLLSRQSYLCDLLDDSKSPVMCCLLSL